VAFLSLERVSSLRDLPSALAMALGRSLPEDQAPLAALVSVLEKQALLLVLDSAEHLLEGVPYLSELLRQCPRLSLLVTSRERLGLEEEWAWTVEGLAVPPEGAGFEDALGFEAVQLFLHRAKRTRLNFGFGPADLPPVRRICQLVGGSPLGIELAAAWVKLMSVSEIAVEIGRDLDFLESTDREVDARHHSLRAVFEQTWERLSSAEQGVFSRLSVFRGGFTRQAAGAMAGASMSTLARLVDKSLIRVAENGRYDIHLLLQQFARERLAHSAKTQATTSDAYGHFLLEFSAQVYAALRRFEDEKLWITRVEQDLENIRVALTAWLGRGETESALSCVVNLRNFWVYTGRMREARMWFARGLASGVGAPGLVVQRALAVDGEMAYLTHDYGEAQKRLEQALALGEVTGQSVALPLLHLGGLAKDMGDLENARLRFEQALHLFRAGGSLPGIAAALNNLGIVLTQLGDYPQALNTFEQALHAKREAGGDTDFVFKNLGDLHGHLGHLETAKSFHLQALHGFVQRGIHHEIPEVLESLAWVLSKQNQPHRAAVLLGAVEFQREAMNTTQGRSSLEALAQSLESIRTALGEESFAAAWAEGRALTLEDAVLYGLEDV